MDTTVLETILQLVMQDTTATVAVAVGLAVVLAVLARVLWGAVSVDEPTAEPISDGGTTSFADAGATDSAETTAESDEELEHRIDELETEVDSLSSTVNTVRNENEQISESVQDIEENTGRLLNLYKKATRGANPFASADDSPESAAVTHDQTDEEFSKEDEIEQIDTQVADDSAADLFDSPDAEIRAEHCVDSVEEVVASGSEPEDAFQRNKQTEQTESAEPVEPVTEESLDEEFEAVFETKTPVESPEADDEQFGTEEMIDTDGEPAQAASDGGLVLEPEPEPETNTSTEPAVEPEPEPEPTPSIETDEEPTAEPSTQEPSAKTTETELPPTVAPATEPPTGTSSDVSDGKPYVDSLPENISTELMTVEWLEYLVDEVGIRGTVRALDYYETIGWLTEDAVEELDEYLAAFEDPDREELSVEHHLKSLDYVEELQHASEE